MSTGPFDPIEEALAGDSSAHDVLDLVDDAIVRAAREADAATLAALADKLDAVAAARGGEWDMLTIAAMRARALVTPSGEGGVAPPRDLADREAPPPPQPPRLAPPRDEAVRPGYVGWWVRAGAFLLDCLVLGIGYGLLTEIAPSDVTDFALLGLPIAYFAGMHAFAGGATVGKAAFGIAVRGPNEGEIGLGRATGRAVVMWLLLFTGIGALVDAIMLGTDRQKQSLHDKIADTVVVRTRGAPRASPGGYAAPPEV